MMAGLMKGQMGKPYVADRPDCLKYLTRGEAIRTRLASFLREAQEQGHTLDSLIRALHEEGWDSSWCMSFDGSFSGRGCMLAASGEK